MKMDSLQKMGFVPGLAKILAYTPLVLAVFFSACSSGSSEVSPDRSDNLTSADEVLAAARDALSSVNSYRTETHLVSKNPVDGRDIFAGTFTLTWSAPDRIHMFMEVTEEGEEAQKSEIISTDGRIMTRESTVGNIWVEYDKEADPDDLEARGILALVERLSAAPDVVPAVFMTTQFAPNIDEAELVGKTVIDGLNVYHLKGANSFKTPPDDWPAEIKEDFPRRQHDSTYDLYISSDDLLPRRLVSILDITLVGSQGEDSGIEPTSTEATSDFLEFNAPVTIELPAVR